MIGVNALFLDVIAGFVVTASRAESNVKFLEIDCNRLE
jgi:hypothetical protein